MNKIFIRTPKFIRKAAMILNWICKPSHANSVFHIQGESGLVEVSDHLRPF